jgi:aminoglycoside 3-N-acetyltransferase
VLQAGEKEKMSEEEVIQATPSPRTRASLTHDLRLLGVQAGMTLIVHSSLRSLGWVSGGPVAVVQALMDIITTEGTLIMPAHTPGYSDPAQWENPPVPQSWWPIIYETMPAFDPAVTPSMFMGQIAETFRTFPGVLRSNHPHVSFTAWGKYAHAITSGHDLEYSLGEGSPLARIYDLAGYVLLLGVGYNNCTSLHLAEYRAPGAVEEMQGAPVFDNGQRAWKAYRDIALDSDVFPIIGAAFEQTGQVKIGQIGSAESRLFPQRPIVDFAVEWLTRRRV